jgi:hypothetical protein
MKRVGSHVTLLVLLVLATAGMVLQNGSVPHVHVATQPGLYNQDHDLTLLANLASTVIPVDVAPALTFDAVSISLAPLVSERPPLRAALSGDSRAPPVR